MVQGPLVPCCSATQRRHQPFCRWEDHSADQVQYDGNIKYEIIKASFVQDCGDGGCQQL